MTPGVCTITLIVLVPGGSPDTCFETVNVIPHVFASVSDSVCLGDSVEINGMYYTEGMYADTIFGGSAQGCDSILLITVSTLAADTSYAWYDGCAGDGYSIQVGENIYDELTPQGTEILTGSDGCDSVVIIDLIFTPPVHGTFHYIGCEGDGFSVQVDSVLYDESNPSGVDTTIAASGCDSVVTIQLVFLPVDMDTIAYHGCSGDGFSVTVQDSLFNEANPYGYFVYNMDQCDSIFIVDLRFDTLTASLSLSGNQMCASPAGLEYSWLTCSGDSLPDTTSCITVSGQGCICVVVTDGMCVDTICQDYLVCELSCVIDAPSGSCTVDSVMMTVSGNFSDSAVVNWLIMTDSMTTITYTATDTVWTNYYLPGCYPIEVTVEDNGCVTTCTDTICIAEKSLADLCCDQVTCDSCATLTIWLSGNPPWNLAITDGQDIDTVTGIMTSMYDHVVCPGYDSLIKYTLLWVRDTTALCEGGIIQDTALVYLEKFPEATIEIQGDTLCAPEGYAYSWRACGDSTVVAIQQCFVPQQSGCYCVTMSTQLSGCVDTACANIIISADHHPGADQQWFLSYDAVDNAIWIHGYMGDPSAVFVTDLLGRNVQVKGVEAHANDLWKVELKKEVPGLVIVTLRGDRGISSKAMFIPDVH